MIDLAPEHLKTVKRILAEIVPDCEVRAFGSRATWTANEHSDLDLAVVSPEPLAWDRRSRLSEAFEESDLPIRVDIVDWDSLSDGFRQTIDGDCVVLQKGKRSVDWRETTIGNCAIINDSTYSPKERWPFINYLDTGNITENRIDQFQHLVNGQDKVPSRARRKVQPGDIVYSTVRPNQRHFGILKELPKNFLASTGFAVIRGRGDIAETDFLYYFLSQDHIVDHLHTIAEHSTSAYPSIKPSDISSLKLSLPPLDEQRRIAHILGTLDDKIELNRRMSQTHEAMAQALFKSWFVDFDPVRAKAEGRSTGLPPDLDALFPDSFQDSELGEIPEGWAVRPLDEVATFTNGLALQRFPPTGKDWLPVIKIAEMRRGYSERTAKASPDIDPKYIIEDGDLLFSWSGSLELTLWSHGRGALNQHLFKVTSDVFPLWFYWGWLRQHLDDFRHIAAGKATTMGHIQRHHLSDAQVVVPSEMALLATDSALGSLQSQLLSCATQGRTLVALRDTFIPQLLSDRLTS